MRTPTDLSNAFDSFDGTRVAPLKELARDAFSPAAQDALFAAIPGPHEIAATWVLKALLESGRLGQGALADPFQKFDRITQPDAALHLLQCAQFAPDAAPLLRPHLSPYYGHSKILLRVWAFDAYCRGAAPEEDLTDRIRQGLTSRHGAMRARSKALARDFGVDLDGRR